MKNHLIIIKTKKLLRCFFQYIFAKKKQYVENQKIDVRKFVEKHDNEFK